MPATHFQQSNICCRSLLCHPTNHHNVTFFLVPHNTSTARCIILYWLACLTTDFEVAGSIPGTSTNLKIWIRFGKGSTQPREDNWVAT